MGNGAMKLAAACGALLAVAVAVAYAQAPATERPQKWVDSFSAYKSYIRPLGPAAARSCEGQLHRILKAIDDNQACSVDSDCTLVGEKPFGQTVPVRVATEKALLSDMKQFRESCNDESRQVGYNSDLVHAPACVKNRCMVKTSSKR